MIRGFGIAFAVFFVVALLGGGVIWMMTRDSSILSKAVLDRAQSGFAAAASAVNDALAEGPPLADGGELLDDGPEAASPDPVGEQLEAYRQEARDGLLMWFLLTMLGGLLAAFSWLGVTFNKARDVHGPEGGRSTGAVWWGGLVLCGAIGGAVAVFILRGLGLMANLAGGMINLGLLLSFALVILGYYLATALGAPKKMRPSVPAATLILR